MTLLYALRSRTWSTGSTVSVIVSLLLHVLFLATGGLNWRRSVYIARPVDDMVQVSLFERPAAPAPAAPAVPLRSAPAEPKVAPPVARPRAVPRPAPEPTSLPVEKPVEQVEQKEEPPPDAPANENPAPGDTAAPPSRAVSAVPRAAGNGPPNATGMSIGAGGPSQVLPFGAGMTRPVQIQGGEPQYTREAQAARVEGKVLVRCVITTPGTVEDCQVLKGVPMLTEIVLENLKKSRFQPVTYQGHPQAIRYLFTYNFKLP
jgi:protein TonB